MPEINQESQSDGNDSIAIMQPYIFPYIGYFHLIKSVDKFIIFDDVNFIKRGYVNRNNILIGGKPSLFSVPLKDASQNKKINEILLNDFGAWSEKFLKTLQQAYGKAPYYEPTSSLIKEIFDGVNDNHISTLCVEAIIKVCKYLNIKTQIIPSSSRYDNSELKAEERIIDICLKENANEYHNAAGGKELYSSDIFREKGIELSFIESRPVRYRQFNDDFVPWLSIIDVMMFNDTENISTLLTNYCLTK